MPDPSPLRILVTGAGGNLGRKLVAHLAEAPWCAAVLALDVEAPAAAHPKVRPLAIDLARRSPGLDAACAEADAAVHLAAQRPYPDATWADAAASFDMTLNLALALGDAGGPKRLVFASSNHVMGGYAEAELAPGTLTTALPPRPGTRTGGVEPERAYAAAKLMGERLLAARAEAGGLTAVSLRIGWCQPGDNRPGTMTASGIPGDPGPDTPEAARILRWFRGMWLSNRDFLAAVSAALRADASAWPAPAIAVNAMSANAGMAWDIGATRALIGYAPQDDSSREVAP
ncbi:NAD-dependent epimerase/dehydratase family protein [Lichenibacterium dinghuense]|uniref:NAD-dependent epimerase/dehydratase family protein n=1 Tax=Lichenibacterium dinghuense TaxID=2895977 RepID=UPI001F1CEFF1|nr:NAD(P)-dependent oxidoreductase [Lichenibacterium sp. 6Y81]